MSDFRLFLFCLDWLMIGLSEKLSEVASRDVVYLSMKQVTPRRRARPAKETLLAIEPALSDQNQRFSLHVDRRTKRGVTFFFNILLSWMTTLLAFTWTTSFCFFVFCDLLFWLRIWFNLFFVLSKR